MLYYNIAVSSNASFGLLEEVVGATLPLSQVASYLAQLMQCALLGGFASVLLLVEMARLNRSMLPGKQGLSPCRFSCAYPV